MSNKKPTADQVRAVCSLHKHFGKNYREISQISGFSRKSVMLMCEDITYPEVKRYFMPEDSCLECFADVEPVVKKTKVRTKTELEEVKEWCKKCYYGGHCMLAPSGTSCDYILVTGHRRPCKPTPSGCDAFRQKKKGEEPIYADIARGSYKTQPNSVMLREHMLRPRSDS